MKKKVKTSKLSLDKKIIANLNLLELSSNDTLNVVGGVGTIFENGTLPSCCGPYKYTSCA